VLLWLGERPVDVAYSGMHKQAVVNPFGMHGCVYITTQLSIYAGGDFPWKTQSHTDVASAIGDC